MLQNLKKRNEEGFTIIEVLIVLAIAGLILLVVFLAVPALQRNQRNTSRKQDASRIAGAATDFVSNNNGTMPSTTADLQAIVDSAGTLGQYKFKNSDGTYNVSASATAADGTLSLATTLPSGGAAITNKDAARLVEQATCDTSGKVQAGTSRQMALQYTTESGSGWQGLCLNVN